MVKFGDMVIGTKEAVREIYGRIVSVDGVKGVVICENPVMIMFEDYVDYPYYPDKEDYIVVFNPAQCLDCQTVNQKNRTDI
jgi:hypothetical protein